MDMNSDKSISLSQCCVVLFALLLAALLLALFIRATKKHAAQKAA